VPFFIVSLIIGQLTVKYQGVEAIGDWDRFSLWERIMYAGHSFTGYIIKFFYPIPLKIFYPYPKFGNPPIETQIAPFAALIIVALAIYFGRRHKALLFGALFYLFSVGLVLQFVSVGGAVMAERYTYLPYVGLSFILAYYITKALSSKKNGKLGMAALALVLVGSLAFARISYKRTAVWQNADRLYTSILKTHPQLHGMRLNRGNYYLATQQYEKALKDYETAIRIKPNNSDPYYNISLIHNYNKRYKRAVEVLDTAIMVNKSDYSLFTARAKNLSLLGKNKRALKDFNRAIEIFDSDPMTYLNRGICHFAFNDWDKAYSDFSKAAAIEPRLPDAFNNMGYVHIRKGENQEALKMFRKTLSLQPNHPNALLNISQVHFGEGDLEKASEFAKRAQNAGAAVNPEYLKQLGI
jgi:tetratricopeptide (TPR) repeat protein